MHRTKIPPCYNCSGPLCVVERTGQTASSPQRNSIPRASVKSTRPEALCARASSQYSDVQPEAATSTQPTGGSESASKRTFLQRVKAFFLADRIDRKRLAELGLGAVASYGFVSNATYGTGMAVSWVAFVKQYGVSPLMPGQWKAFMAWYAGFWTIQHFLRPFRFSLALALSPAFDCFITWTHNRTGFSRRNAFGVYLTLLGTLSSLLIFGSIFMFAGPLAFARRPLPA